MPYATEFFDDGTGLLRVGTGIVTFDEIIAGARDLHLDEARARKLTHALVDFTGVTELRVSTDEARRIAEASKTTARLAPGGVVAVVAPKDHVFGMARMWETLVDEEAGWLTRVFRERAEAEAWIRARLANGHRETA